MKPFVFVSLLIACLFAPAAPAAVHDVLAHSSTGQVWVARVAATKTASGSSIDQTSILVRQSGPGREWNNLVTIPARVSAMAARSSSLVVLLSSGDWMSIWGPAGGSTGSPLPAEGRIRAIANDGDSLWAVGSVRGGLAMTTRPAATEAATTEPAAAAAEAEPTTLPAPPALPTLPPKLVLFQQQNGGWVALAEFPPDVFVSPGGDISLTVVAGRPLVAFQLTDGAIRTLRFNAKNAWEDVGLIAPESGETIAAFQLVSIGDRAVLWTSGGKGAGLLYPAVDARRARVDLKWIGGHEPDSIPAVTFTGGYLRVIGLSDDKLYEQRYETSGEPVGSAAQIVAPAEISDSTLEYWINGALCFALAFSAGAMLYRRALQQKSGVELKTPVPAPLRQRLAAGVIDALPVLIVFAVVSLYGNDGRSELERLQEWSSVIAGGIAVAVYLLHTTLTELFTGRSAGKWALGLKVVSLDGSKPSAGQVVIRNLLRVIDLLWFPLMLVLISPLRQRSGDLAAGTMVVLATEQQEQPVESNRDESSERRGS
jgi:uncharacterized RDD family membrane protein YckC